MQTSEPASTALEMTSDNHDVESANATSQQQIENQTEHDCGHKHYSERAPWLRAALLGANDGLVSTASLMIGVGAVRTDNKAMLISGLSGLIAGACSMAIGEYISVYGQRDTEKADIKKEREEFAKGPHAVEKELRELTQIYVERGLNPELARQVAEEFHKIDPIRAHARDELGIDMDDLSNPSQAAIVSAIAFCSGAIIPLLSASFISNYTARIVTLICGSTVGFTVIGGSGAWVGGANIFKASARGIIGGWAAMAITYGILKLFGSAGI